MRFIATILLASAMCSHAQRGTLTFVTEKPPVQSSLALPAVIGTTNRQLFLTWTAEAGASNRVSWGLARNAWTNGVRTITTNTFPITNGWHYKVTAMINGIESVPALWPSNKFERVWVQTSTNLTSWSDAFIWQTNYNKPQEFLRLRGELLRWE